MQIEATDEGFYPKFYFQDYINRVL